MFWRALFTAATVASFHSVQAALPFYSAEYLPLIYIALLLLGLFAPTAAVWVLSLLAGVAMADHYLPAAGFLAVVAFFLLVATDYPWHEVRTPVLALFLLAAPWLVEHGLPFVLPILVGFLLPADAAFWAATGIGIWQFSLSGVLARPFATPDFFPAQPWVGSLVLKGRAVSQWFSAQTPDFSRNFGQLLNHFAHYWPGLAFILSAGAAAAVVSAASNAGGFTKAPIHRLAGALAGGQVVWLPAYLVLSEVAHTQGMDPSALLMSGVICSAVVYAANMIGLGPRPAQQPYAGARAAYPDMRLGAGQRPQTRPERRSKRIVRWTPEGWKWPRVVGYEQVKRELFDAARTALDNQLRAELSKARVRVPRGILLYGPPGTGKTTLARDLAEQAGLTFRSFSGAEFFSKYIGDSEKQLRQIFASAREGAANGNGYILFFDEIEAFLQPRTGDMLSAMHGSVVSTFLGEMDGFKGLEGVLVIGATNVPDQIDPAAVRPGRFDRIIYVGTPDRTAREALWRFYLTGKKHAHDLDVGRLASRTERYTAADIENICTSVYLSARQRGRAILSGDIEDLLKANKPSLSVATVKKYESLRDRFSRTGNAVERDTAIERPDVKWEQIAGQTEAKRILHEAITLLSGQGQGLAAAYELKPPKGVLLFGPPGCGKTLLAKAVASHLKASFFLVNGPELVSKWLGQTENNLRDIFDRARENSPAVLFLDEIDSLAGSRPEESGLGRHHALEQLLTEMDGMDAVDELLVMGATNRPDLLDAALLRPGRFDRVLYIKPPDAAERQAAFRLHLAGKPGADSVDYAALAAAAAGFSGADIFFACNQTLLNLYRTATSEGKPIPVTTQAVLETIGDMNPSLRPEDLHVR